MANTSLQTANILFRNGDFEAAEIEYKKNLSISDSLDAIVLWNLLRIESQIKKRSIKSTNYTKPQERPFDQDRICIRTGPTRMLVFHLMPSVDKLVVCDVVSEPYLDAYSLQIWKVSDTAKSKLNLVDLFHINASSFSHVSQGLWVIVHLAKINSIIMLLESNEAIVQKIIKGYYSDFLIVNADGGFLLISSPQFLDEIFSVSFCIPAGGDTLELRRCVERILEFDFDKEIIICGDIPNTFPYIDDVIVVGRDIPFPPLRLCVKKNAAIERAQSAYLCVLHDRILLPDNFPELFLNAIPLPIMAISGLYMLGDDYSSIGRYSDFNIAQGKPNFPKIDYLSQSESCATNAFNRSSRFLFARSNDFSYCVDDVLDEGYAYATGSFFLMPRDVYEKVRLDASFYWEDYEDVQWAIRTIEYMIPHVYNTDYFHLTQAVRPTILPPIPLIYFDDQSNLIREFFDIVPLPENELIDSNFSDWLGLFLKRLQLFLIEYPTFNFSFQHFEKSIHKDRSTFLSEFEKMLGAVAPSLYSAEFISRLEKLLGITFEVADLQDQRIHSEHFNQGFSFAVRIIDNWAYKQWSKYFKLGALSYKPSLDASRGSEFKSILKRVNNIRRQLYNLNNLFSINYSVSDWFFLLRRFEF